MGSKQQAQPCRCRVRTLINCTPLIPTLGLRLGTAKGMMRRGPRRRLTQVAEEAEPADPALAGLPFPHSLHSCPLPNGRLPLPATGAR